MVMADAEDVGVKGAQLNAIRVDVTSKFGD